ncbi:MAG: MFS transporter [Candidatus Limnocylindrales bacterium]
MQAGLSVDTPGAEGQAGAPSPPRMPLGRARLLGASVYWFGISAMWGGAGIFGQHQVEVVAGSDTRGVLLGVVALLGGIVAIVVQPLAGSLSDRSHGRWGRRAPWIVAGASLSVLFVVGVAGAASALALIGWLLLLQCSANIAQGPYQAYIPDLVPESQVGTASGLVGLVRLMGVIGGTALVSIGARTDDYATPLIAAGVIQLALATVSVASVRGLDVTEHAEGRPRAGLGDTLRQVFGRDVMRERSFLAMTATRFLFLMGPAVFVGFSLYYVRDALGQSGAALQEWLTIGTITVGVGTLLGTLPGARLSDRLGRKVVIRMAAVLTGVGIVLTALAPNPPLAIPGILMLGLGSGAYIAVDWALMTETIPPEQAGRYMGLANIANSVATPMAVLLGGILLDEVTRSGAPDMAPRVATLLGVLFICGALVTLQRVHPRRGTG